MPNPKILIILTSHNTLGHTDQPTGFWLEELAVPYNSFKAAGAQVTLASPKGGKPPLDPRSDEPSDEVKKFLADPDAVKQLESTHRLSRLDEAFDAIYVVGGHGAMWDLSNHPAVVERVERTWREGGVVSAVCHGSAALTPARKPDGTPMVKGKNVTGFANDEEREVGLEKVVPFLLEDRLRALEGFYSQGEVWQPHVVRDGRMITGQNPASSKGVAEAVLEILLSGTVSRPDAARAELVD